MNLVHRPMAGLTILATVLIDFATGAQKHPFFRVLPFATEANRDFPHRLRFGFSSVHAIAGRLARKAIDHTPIGQDVATVFRALLVMFGIGAHVFSLPLRNKKVSYLDPQAKEGLHDHVAAVALEIFSSAKCEHESTKSRI